MREELIVFLCIIKVQVPIPGLSQIHTCAMKLISVYINYVHNIVAYIWCVLIYCYCAPCEWTFKVFQEDLSKMN